MIERQLLFVSPHPRGATIPSRPSAFWSVLSRPDAFRSSVRIERQRPDRYLARRVSRDREPEASFGTAGLSIRHPWPFGPLERRFLRRLVASREAPVVLWISDPKSAPVFRDLAAMSRDRCLLVFDAYDAWDLSPLVRGRRRERAVADGYQAAATHADVVFGNTPFVVERFRRWGARNVVLLPNAAPERAGPDATPTFKPVDRARPFLLYVGRVHERVDVPLLATVAAAFPEVEIRIAGPVEREPSGWRDFVRAPNVRLVGPLPPSDARQLMACAAACLVPHVVDDYSSSQDSMKAWDALSVGAPVISTSVPPANAWGPELALVANDATAFVEAVARVLGGAMSGSRARRLEFAAANTWEIRAHEAISVLHSALAP